MRTLITILMALSLGGCSTAYKWIPSFGDDNQSLIITDVRLRVERLDCNQPQAVQALAIKDSVDRFMLYSESKGQLQQDVIHLVEPMKKTVDDFYKRSQDKEGSKTYCELKKKIMREQAQRAAASVMGRW